MFVMYGGTGTRFELCTAQLGLALVHEAPQSQPLDTCLQVTTSNGYLASNIRLLRNNLWFATVATVSTEARAMIYNSIARVSGFFRCYYVVHIFLPDLRQRLSLIFYGVTSARTVRLHAHD